MDALYGMIHLPRHDTLRQTLSTGLKPCLVQPQWILQELILKPMGRACLDSLPQGALQ